MIALNALANRIIIHKGREYRLKKGEEAPQMPTELRRLLVEVGLIEGARMPQQVKAPLMKDVKEEDEDGTASTD